VKQRALLDAQAAAQFDRQQAMLAKEEAFIAPFKARASHAAQVQSRVKKIDKIERVRRQDPRAGNASTFTTHRDPGTTSPSSRASRRPTAEEDLRGPRPHHPAEGALVRHGGQRRRQVDAAQDGGGATEPDEGRSPSAPASRWLISPSTRWSCSTRRSRSIDTLNDRFPKATVGSLRTLAGAFGFSGERGREDLPRPFGRRKKRGSSWPCSCTTLRTSSSSMTDQSLDLATKEMLIEALRDLRSTMLFVSTTGTFFASCRTGCSSLGRRVKTYGGGTSNM